MDTLILANAMLFLSTLSLRRATARAWTCTRSVSRFLSTLSLRRATAGNWFCGVWADDFYPRSPCGERQDPISSTSDIYKISIHALLAESDGEVFASKPRRVLFLSTLSLRRATGIHTIWACTNKFLSTLSLRRATKSTQPPTPRVAISIHALLAESDTMPDLCQRYVGISIHALLAESDVVMEATKIENQYFYPRSPCGERPCQ